jgi:hypothetical protein
VNVVMANATGVTEIHTLNNWNIFPNPSSGQTTVAYTISQNSDLSITVFDLVGRQVGSSVKISNQIAGYHEAGLDVADLQSGTYLVRVTANHTVETKRLSVVK